MAVPTHAGSSRSGRATACRTSPATVADRHQGRADRPAAGRAACRRSRRAPSSRPSGCRRWPTAPRSWPASPRRPGVALPGAGAQHEGAGGARSPPAAEEIAMFGAASESFCRKNINCSIAESLERFRPVVEARAGGRHARARLCLLRARLPLRRRGRRSRRWPRSREALVDLGCYEVSLGDTIGVGTPGKARAMVEAVAATRPARAPRRSTSTTPTARRSPTSTPAWSSASRPSTARSPGSAAAPTPGAPPATSRPRTCSTCSTGSASRPASTSTAVAAAGRIISARLGRAPAVARGGGAGCAPERNFMTISGQRYTAVYR